VSVFVLYCAIFITMTLPYNLKTGIVLCPVSYIMLRIILVILGHLCFHRYFIILFFISVKNFTGIFIDSADCFQ
jgi:hypothetical protein